MFLVITFRAYHLYEFLNYYLFDNVVFFCMKKLLNLGGKVGLYICMFWTHRGFYLLSQPSIGELSSHFRLSSVADAVEWNNVTPGTIHAVLKKDRQSS